MSDESTDRSRDEWASGGSGQITPADVQQRQFRTARLGGGYRMREVDEFLDQVTDTLSSLIQENERLRREASGSPAPAPAASAAPPVTDAADRAAIQAFLEREKAFLQNLGGLVQGHAQDLRNMVRSSRSAGRAGATPSSAAAPEPDAPEGPEPVDDVPPGPSEDTSAVSDDGEEQEAPPAATDDARTIEGQDAVEVVDVADETGWIPEIEAEAGTEAEEPIRLDEPTPTRGRREESSGSLRELFWGEE